MGVPLLLKLSLCLLLPDAQHLHLLALLQRQTSDEQLISALIFLLLTLYRLDKHHLGYCSKATACARMRARTKATSRLPLFNLAL